MKWYIYEKKDDPSEIIIGLAETIEYNNDKIVLEINKDFSMAHRTSRIIDRRNYVVSDLDQHILDAFVLKMILKLKKEPKWFEIVSLNKESYYIYASSSNFVITVDSKIKLKDIYVFKGKEKVHIDDVTIHLEGIEYIEETSIEPMKCFNVGDIYTWDDNYSLILKKTEVGYRIVMLVKDNIYITTLSFENDFLDKIKYSGNISIENLNMRLIITKFMNKINE